MSSLVRAFLISGSTLLVSAVSTAHAASSTYRAVDLGRLGSVQAITNARVIVGATAGGGLNTNGYVYSAGVLSSTGPLGGTTSRLHAINERGIAVGNASLPSGFRHAVSFANGVLTDLGTFGGGQSGAWALNDAGQIVGFATRTTGVIWPFLHAGSRISELGVREPTANISYMSVNDINAQGRLAGYYNTSSEGSWAFVSTLAGGPVTPIGRAAEGTTTTPAINASGTILFNGPVGTTARPSLYVNGTITELGTLNNLPFAIAAGLNTSGEVVGWCANPDGTASRACLFANGTVIDLNSTVTLPDFTLENAWAINDAGEIVCGATNADRTIFRTYLLLPPNSRPEITTAPVDTNLVIGAPASLTVVADGDGALSYQWSRNGTPIAGATSATFTLSAAQGTDVGRYTVTVANAAGSVTSQPVVLSAATAELPVLMPAITAQPGAAASLAVTATGTAPTYQWRFNDVPIAGATTATLVLTNVQTAQAGLYTAVVTDGSATRTSVPAIVGVSSTTVASGSASVVGADIHHPLGGIYDQVLLQGTSATITADPEQVTRLSFLDLTDDIVQVELSGAGALTVTLENASGPAAPTKYNQPDVAYMKGHARLVLVGTDATTNLTVFSVGRANAVNQGLFRDNVSYDGIADIASLAISSPSGQMAAVRTANASYGNTTGLAGIYAPGVDIAGPLYVGDVNASGNATPVLRFARNNVVTITGGDLFQANSQAVRVTGVIEVKFSAGATSGGTSLPVQTNQGHLDEYGVDVTGALVH